MEEKNKIEIHFENTQSLTLEYDDSDDIDFLLENIITNFSSEEGEYRISEKTSIYINDKFNTKYIGEYDDENITVFERIAGKDISSIVIDHDGFFIDCYVKFDGVHFNRLQKTFKIDDGIYIYIGENYEKEIKEVFPFQYKKILKQEVK